jgi:hypothetical protein
MTKIIKRNIRIEQTVRANDTKGTIYTLNISVVILFQYFNLIYINGISNYIYQTGISLKIKIYEKPF